MAAKKGKKGTPAKKTGGRKPQSAGTRKGAGSSDRSAGSSGGMPPFKPTDGQRESVGNSLGCGIPLQRVALATTNPRTGRGISVHTLKKHFPAEIEEGRARFESLIADTLAAKLKAHDTATTIFLAKAILGLRDKDPAQVIPDGQHGTLEIRRPLDSEEWRAWEEFQRQRRSTS